MSAKPVANYESSGSTRRKGEIIMSPAPDGHSNTGSLRRSWWGWGWEQRALSDKECADLGALIPGLRDTPLAAPPIDALELRTSRVTPPASLSNIVSTADTDRAAHSFGKAYRDIARALYGQIPNPPDAVAYPETESDVERLLDWASSEAVAVVPFGGGTSVVGGVEYRGSGFERVLSLDLQRLDRVLEIDETSLSARIQSGVLGPALEDQLRPHGYTLRHYPQSFEFSSLGGWIATRAGGHFATLHTHIDDFVESIRTMTPAGVMESWRLPGSGAGPSPDRLMIGSEGTLGVITEAWMRIQKRPEFRVSRSVTFDSAATAFRAVRAIAQSGLNPANCRLLDPGEAALSGASLDGSWVLVLGVESAILPVDHMMEELTTLAQDYGARVPESSSGSRSPVADHSDDHGDAAAESWRSAFLRMPYQRDGLLRMSGIVETFETACTWDRVEAVYNAITTDLGDAIESITGSRGLINCRLTHVYPNGAAPYFTVVAAGRPRSEVSMWDEIKAASMEILTQHRATVTHHHAVGRDHMPGYVEQRPELFDAALRAAKSALDPAGIMNPGVLMS